MTARELRLGDRVTISKGRTRYTVVVIVRGAKISWLPEFDALGVREHWRADVAVVVRNARSYWRGKARGKGRRVALDRLVRVKR